MSVFQLPPDVLRVGEPTPFALRDKTGCLLVPRGLMVSSEDQLQQLAARDLYVDEQDSEALRRAIAGFMADPEQPWNAHPAYWAPFVVIGG